MRLRMRSGRQVLQGIWFSANAESASVEEGDVVDVAYLPQINEFRGERTPQLNVVDIRPSCTAECTMETVAYRQLRRGNVDESIAQSLFPDRNTLGVVWRYLAASQKEVIEENPGCLCRKIVRQTNMPLNLGKLLVCLDVFAEVGLISMTQKHKNIAISLCPAEGKTDLLKSRTMQMLQGLKVSE